jgi:hypothetical protein
MWGSSKYRFLNHNESVAVQNIPDLFLREQHRGFSSYVYCNGIGNIGRSELQRIYIKRSSKTCNSYLSIFFLSLSVLLLLHLILIEHFFPLQFIKKVCVIGGIIFTTDRSLSVHTHVAQKITCVLLCLEPQSDAQLQCSNGPRLTIYTLGLLNLEWDYEKERNNRYGRMMSCVWRIQFWRLDDEKRILKKFGVYLWIGLSWLGIRFSGGFCVDGNRWNVEFQ